MSTTILIIVIVTFLGLLLLNSGGAAREGSYRRGPGWYLDTTTPRDTLMGGRFVMPGRGRTSRWLIVAWAVAGAAFVIMGLILVFISSVAIGVIVSVVGGLLLLLTMSAARQNRRSAELEAQDGE